MVKRANGEEHKEEGTTKLKSKIDLLTAILKSSSFGTNKPQGGASRQREASTKR